MASVKLGGPLVAVLAKSRHSVCINSEDRNIFHSTKPVAKQKKKKVNINLLPVI